MAKVFLRVYNREIESMIEGGQLDESVAHCQYILKSFPMHVDTYRLLGKAFLEARRYADAADIFQRVLMAVPDDFVSHVGMSIIRDDENKMDDAIWHMERAFEVQPSNSAIQGELRRLYGRRDGVEPSKIRLSRDALANMYSQGELFNQAIAEIRSVLAEDNNRPDLQVMLARAYYRSGQKVEAAEMAAALLKKYPYCMDSLRVLVDVLPGTARAENTQVYRQRLHNLDPYSSFTVNSVFASDQVSDSAVNLERLEYKSSPASGSSQPDWASSLGIKLNDEKQADTPPAWMQTSEETESPVSNAPESLESSTAPVAAESDKVPEWMRSAGWQESDLAAQAGAPENGELSDEEPIAKADIPEWLKSMAPTEATEENKPETDEPAEVLPVGEDGIPEWLKPTGSVKPVETGHSEVPQSEQPQADNPADVPDWLDDIAPAVAAGGVLAQNQPPVESQQANVEPQAQNAEEIPNWLKSMAPAAASDEIQDANNPPPDASQPGHAESQPVGIDSSAESSESMQPAAVDDELKSNVSDQPVESPQVPNEAQPTSAEEVPDWLKPLSPTDAVDENQAESAVQPVESQPLPGEPQPASTGEFPDWLKSLSPTETASAGLSDAAQPAESQPVPGEPQPANPDEVPDWFKSLGTTAAIADITAGANLPAEPQIPSSESQATGADDVLDWLKSLDSAESTGEKPAETVQPPAEPQQEIVEPAPETIGGVPDSVAASTPVNAVDEISAEAVQPAAAESQPVGMDATPDWLKPLTPTNSAEAAPAESTDESAEGIPDWLKSMAPVDAAEAAKVENEPAASDVAPVVNEPESIPVEPSMMESSTSPDWQSVGSSRADAAALSAKAMEQPATSEPPLAELPGSEDLSVQAPSQPSIPPSAAASESFQPTGEVKPLNIGDDAFSWLESLAAKQGAKPEELLTNPEERSVEMPDWLRQPEEKPTNMAEPTAPVPVEPEPIQTPAETLPLEPLSGFDQEPGSNPVGITDENSSVKDEIPSSDIPAEVASLPVDQPVNAKDDTMAWLESLRTDQPTKSEEPTANPVQDLGTTPGWTQENQDNPPATPSTEEAVLQVPEPAPAQEDISITSWLSKLDVDDAVAKKIDEISAGAPPAAPAEELPDWLKDLDKPAAPAETPKADGDLPDWLRHPIPSDSGESAAPAPDSDLASEPEISTWVDENVSATGETAPTLPEEWLPAETKLENIPNVLPTAEPAPFTEAPIPSGANIEEGAPQAAEVVTGPDLSSPIESKPNAVIPEAVKITPIAEPVPIPVSSPVVRPTLKQTGMLSHIPSLDKDAELLNSAQNVLDQNSLDDAMKKYSKLIKKGRLLDEVIHDLREAIYRYPVDVIVWQTLGDAYMRANRLQDALDAYTKAEELLR